MSRVYRVLSWLCRVSIASALRVYGDIWWVRHTQPHILSLLKFLCKDNTKSPQIQIYFRFFAKMAHFAFPACKPLSINAEKSSFFHHFSCTFPKTTVLTKIAFHFVREDSINTHTNATKKMEHVILRELTTNCVVEYDSPLIFSSH